MFAPSYGDAAQKAVFPAVQANAWMLFENGKAKVSPDTVGIAEALSEPLWTHDRPTTPNAAADQRAPRRAPS